MIILNMGCMLFSVIMSMGCVMCTVQYDIDDTGGVGRLFDGIGGLSAGASSKLLMNYKEPQRSQILDYLFKPNFGASLQILKVEIGGDGQSTDGTEASHMHHQGDENYQRGYEWGLMLEAKKRNPGIKLYGLPWSFPGWLDDDPNSAALSSGNRKWNIVKNNSSCITGGCKEGTVGNPYKYLLVTATYIIKWILGARKYHNLTIDYIGIWNERIYSIPYILTLRKLMDQNGLRDVKIIASDNKWEITSDVLKNSTLKDAIYAIGVHYPGTISPKAALKTGLKLWSSEDYSTFNDNIGGGCWARLLNQNYVNGHITSTVSWALIASYYNQLPFPGCGLTTAVQPWSGHYEIKSPIWISAHTTQFTQIGWSYLKHGSGVGFLQHGGSYVSLVSADRKEFTVVIETMSHNHSACIRPYLPPYNVTNQTAVFSLHGNLTKINLLHVWYSKFGGNSTAILMKNLSDIRLINGSFSLHLEPDSVYTFTTISTRRKGQHTAPPAAKDLQLPYRDNFDTSQEYSEANNWAPQIGSFEIRKSVDISHGMVNRQTVMEKPINWCCESCMKPITMGGNYNWSHISVYVDVYISSVNGSDGAFIAQRVNQGGCKTNSAAGLFLWIYLDNQTFVITSDYAQTSVLQRGKAVAKKDEWFNIGFYSQGNQLMLTINRVKNEVVLNKFIPDTGFVAYGTTNFGVADFDNFIVQQTSWISPS